MARFGGNGEARALPVEQASTGEKPKKELLIKSLSECVPDLRREATLPKIETPFPKLNEGLGGGLCAAQLTTIVGATGSGKSSLAMNIGWHAAQLGHTVVYIAGEMTYGQILARVLSHHTGNTWRFILNGRRDDDEMQYHVANVPFYVVRYQWEWEIREFLDELIQKVRKTDECILIIADYAQKLTPHGSDLRRATVETVQEIADFVETNEVCGLLLSQTSRGGAKALRSGASNPVDLVNTAAESGVIENSSVNLINISYQPEPGVEWQAMTLHVSKSRYSGPFKTGVRFRGATGEFSELEEAPLTASAERMREQILESAAAASKPLSKNKLLQRDGKKLVTGNRQTALQEIRNMAREGLLYLDPETGSFSLPQRGEG
jgi:archaellum biogenesis ATPase FlaH